MGELFEMYMISIYDYFSSAHQLRGYQGNCEKLHGHNWKVEVKLQGESLDGVGMLFDFKQAKAMLKEILGELDHTMLNELEAFKANNPSAERIAEYVYHRIKGKLSGEDSVGVAQVAVWESERSKAVYWE